MFVDDNLMAEIRQYIRPAMAASIEALFRLLGYPDQDLRKSPLCMEKFLLAVCLYVKVQLGKEINTRTMTVHMSSKMFDKLLQDINNWHSHQKSFTILQAAKLLGIIEHAASYVIWAKFLYYGLRHSILIALRKNCTAILGDSRFRDLVHDSTCAEKTLNSLLKRNFSLSKLA